MKRSAMTENNPQEQQPVTPLALCSRLLFLCKFSPQNVCVLSCGMV